MTPSNDEEEDTGPSVESSDPEERILARRLRIQKRIEQQKRLIFFSVFRLSFFLKLKMYIVLVCICILKTLHKFSDLLLKL